MVSTRHDVARATIEGGRVYSAAAMAAAVAVRGDPRRDPDPAPVRGMLRSSTPRVALPRVGGRASWVDAVFDDVTLETRFPQRPRMREAHHDCAFSVPAGATWSAVHRR